MIPDFGCIQDGMRLRDDGKLYIRKLLKLFNSPDILAIPVQGSNY